MKQCDNCLTETIKTVSAKVAGVNLQCCLDCADDSLIGHCTVAESSAERENRMAESVTANRRYTRDWRTLSDKSIYLSPA